MMKEMFKKLVLLPRQPFLLMIFFYQKTLSPDHGLLKVFFRHGYCKYYPSCSEYAYQIIQKKGLVVGGLKTMWRIIRCNPYSKGGVDLPN